MAHVIRSSQLDSTIEHYLQYLADQWSSIPQMVEEWDDWDREEQLTFMSDWGVVDDRGAELHRWADEGLLTPKQLRRYQSLQKLVAAQKPVVARMFQE
jgi:hypothetical protein